MTLRWLYARPEGAWAPVAAFGAPKPPAPPPPEPIPDLQDPALAARKKQTAAAAQARSGRLSTMLTDEFDGDKLGLR